MNVKSGDGASALAILDYRHFLAFGILHILWLEEQSVRVSAEHEVDTSGLLDDTLVAGSRVANLPTEVGEAYHDVALLLATQNGNHTLCHRNRVEVFSAAIVGCCDESLQTW